MKRMTFTRRLTRRLRTSRRARILTGLGLMLAFPLAAVVLVVASVWIEDRHPGDDPGRALHPGVQGAVTRPIVNFLSRQAERHVRERADLMFTSTGMSLEETLARFLDESVDLRQRRIHAYRLARVGSPECMEALLRVLRGASPEDKAFMAQLIGSTGNPAAKPWLMPLLDDPDERVVRAAIRGLGAIGGDDVTRRIEEFLGDATRPESIRIEAAIGLGMLATPAAGDALIRALDGMPSEDLAVEILGGLGQIEFPRVAATFERLLSNPEASPDLRVAAVEALSNSSDEAVPFLLAGAEHDPDPELRASAAWAISAHVANQDLGEDLMKLAEREPEADVRRRLYEAMVTHSPRTSGELLGRVLAEQDMAARVAGFNAVGVLANRGDGSVEAAGFDHEAAPELVEIAIHPNNLNLQMRAVFALRRAGTPAAREALAAIASNAPPQVATAARNGLKAAPP